MCGICGFVPRASQPSDYGQSVVKRMMGAMVHRGPDGAGLVDRSGVTLGHRRLAIIDPSERGRQPMSNEDRNVWLTCNGEIYNFRSLRRELEADGHHFSSDSDSEVLVHGYEQWGIDGLLPRVVGMFAFALLDERFGESKLTLVRDRIGIKPLYYYDGSDGFAFSSEVRALAQSQLRAFDRRPEAVWEFLQYGSIPEPETWLKGVQTVPAGGLLEVDRRGTQVRKYWSLADSSPDARVTTARDLRGLLDQVVADHLVSDAPLGIFLSGGIDSSSLVALAAPRTPQPLKTLSVEFEQASLSEAPYSSFVAERFATDHTSMTVRARDFMDELPRVFDSMDQPTVDGVNNYFVSRAAQRCGLKVAFSGTGGDEVFLGYRHFHAAHQRQFAWSGFKRLPGRVRSPMAAVAGKVGSAAAREALAKLDYLGAGRDSGLYLLYRGLFSTGALRRLLPEAPAGSESLRLKTMPAEGSSSVQALQELEFEHYLKNQLLRDADVMGMAHSLEIRVPFLDHRLVETVVGLPDAMKFDVGRNKSLLVDALGSDLPSQVWDRPKMGFTFPFQQWLTEHEVDLRTTPGVLDSQEVDRVWRRFHAGRAHWSLPWATLVAERFWG